MIQVEGGFGAKMLHREPFAEANCASSAAQTKSTAEVMKQLLISGCR